MKEYESKAKTTKIQANARVSIKIKESFYTFEYSEERSVPDTNDVDIERERELLWNTVIDEVDNQADRTWKIITEQTK